MKSVFELAFLQYRIGSGPTLDRSTIPPYQKPRPKADAQPPKAASDCAEGAARSRGVAERSTRPAKLGDRREQ